MLPEVVTVITNYGYLAIFVLVFSQEIGIPNPVPNELVLAFSGGLAYKGLLAFPLVILTAVSADFIGTNILYLTFYFFGRYILKNKPKWWPISDKVIARLSIKVKNGGTWAIFLGRITPFLRGYTSVAAGLFQIGPAIFLPIAFISGITWASVCVFSGSILTPYWHSHKQVFAVFFIMGMLTLLVVVLFRYLKKRPIH